MGTGNLKEVGGGGLIDKARLIAFALVRRKSVSFLFSLLLQTLFPQGSVLLEFRVQVTGMPSHSPSRNWGGQSWGHSGHNSLQYNFERER